MNQEIKKLWIDALRSGEYGQCKGVLHSEEGYCCLGVLTDIYHKKTGMGEWIASLSYTNFNPAGRVEYVFQDIDARTSDKTLLPKKVTEWAELSDNCPTVQYRDYDLANLNDGRHVSQLSFSAIADIIEAQL
jgi:hypothetical protein